MPHKPTEHDPAPLSRDRDAAGRAAVEIARHVRLLRLRALRPVRTRLAGAYAGAFHGPGMAFEELRHYQPGDEVRHMDWHVLARLGEPFVRRFTEERELRVILAADVSGSMDVPAGGTTKRRTACEAAAVLALSAARQGDRVGAMLFGGRSARTVPVRRGERHALHVLRLALSERPAGGPTDVRPLLDALAHLRAHAVVFLLSDMLFDPPMGNTEVRRILARVARRHELVAVTVRHPAESDPGEGALLESTDPETGASALLDLYAGRARALPRRLHALRRQAHEAFSSLRVGCVGLTAGEDCTVALQHFFRGRAQGRAAAHAHAGSPYGPSRPADV